MMALLDNNPPGVVSITPRILECQECGVRDDADTVGLPRSARANPNLVHVCSTLRFHPRGWPDGTNPRLCKQCRLARGCKCWRCEWERR